MKQLKVKLKERSYTITVGKGILDSADEFFNLNRTVFVLTDDGVPKSYSERIASRCKKAIIYTIPQGEKSKNIDTYVAILKEILNANLTRTDAVVGVGGGVVGDLAGFCASTFMRGIDFYNVPTTLLSMVDSSIGGKTGVDFCGVKNSVGTFCQPKGVLIDLDTLSTLNERQFKAGLVESIKMAATFSEELFSLFEEGDIRENLEDIIVSSLKIKKRVVEKDEKEGGLRKVLNFGHTYAHAVEGAENMDAMLHGEAVAVGMMQTSSGEAKERIAAVFSKLKIKTEYHADKTKLAEFIRHDKKCSGDQIDIIKTQKIGTYEIARVSVDDFINGIL